ncbi:nuclear transport factor 2 family protein [Salegentibacter salegens]|uniref:SnoaL-like domain-containing protein n=1 Tax=Salegentibacter salegens TaxID=143223 RepID=A0A1M7LWD2_9FLAO|nr:nuclear transport factor 2 family protein [Salegentibacter salegens]PRX52137.1 SnoaL-like protein [Salegentibacter salegens]SHM82615.1 SnoaL-like domain-containing protein [Salegentibacter salegens]
MKKFITLLFLIFSLNITAQEKSKIDKVLTEWHMAAAEANFEKYFRLMTRDGVFIGTDASENWQNDDFREFSKPYFDRGNAWSFTSLERNIYTQKNSKTAWFDELLNTQMGICRGSGVLQKTEDGWKIAHYVLSITVPNENVEKVTQLKKEYDQKLINQID